MLDTVHFPSRSRGRPPVHRRQSRATSRSCSGSRSVPIISFVGAAVDYTRANSARSSMQAALDSTALMLAKDLHEGTITTSQITAKAQAYFRALYTNTGSQVDHDHRDLYPKHWQRLDYPGQRLRRRRHRIHAGRGLPEPRFQHQFHLGLGQRADARRDGARQYRIDGLERQDGGDADGRQEPGRSAQRARQESRRHLHLDGSRSPRTSISAPATTISPGSTGTIGRSHNDSWGTCSKSSYTTKSHVQKQRQDLDARITTKWTGCVTDRDQDYDTKNTTPTSSKAPTMVAAEEYVVHWNGNVRNDTANPSSSPYVRHRSCR